MYVYIYIYIYIFKISGGFSYHQEFFKSWTTKFQSEDKTSFKNLKKTSHHHLIILIFRISLSFFQKLFLTSAKYLCFLFPFFLENFSSNKKFHERKKLIRELKKEKKKKIKREEEKKTLPKCVLVSFNAVNTIFRNTFVH